VGKDGNRDERSDRRDELKLVVVERHDFPMGEVRGFFYLEEVPQYTGHIHSDTAMSV
jgi:hypothetical protein